MFEHGLRYETLAFGVMDKLRLQFAKYCCDFLRRFPLMNRSGIVGCKCFLQHFAREFDQGACSVSRRKDEDVSSIDPGAPVLVKNT